MTAGPRFLSHFTRFTLVSSMLVTGFLSAQQLLPTGQPITPAPADPAIAAALQQVSPDNIKAIITKLVSFKNRRTHANFYVTI